MFWREWKRELGRLGHLRKQVSELFLRVESLEFKAAKREFEEEVSREQPIPLVRVIKRAAPADWSDDDLLTEERTLWVEPEED